MHYIIIFTAKLILPCCFLLPGLLLESLAGHFEVISMGRLKENNVNKVSTRYTEYAVAYSLSRNVSKSVLHVSFVARLGVHCDAVR
jgi:hypothetical protein